MWLAAHRTLRKPQAWANVVARLMIAALLAGLLPGAGTLPQPVQAAVVLEITNRTSPFIILDHNKTVDTPNVYLVEVQICNTGTDVAHNVYAYIGDYSVGPGVMPSSSPSDATPRLLDEYLHPTDLSDATRYLGDLIGGECQGVFWPLWYPLQDGNNVDLPAGTTFSPEVWVVADGYSSSEMAITSQTRNTLSASSNTLWTATASVAPTSTVQIGQQVDICFTGPLPLGDPPAPGVNFGLVGNGLNGVNDLWFQPSGETTWDPSSLRLVGTSAYFYSNKCSNDPYTYVDRTYLNLIDSGSWDGVAGVEACQANSQQISGGYCYTFVAIGNGENTFKPYQQASSSGNNQAYNGDYGRTTTVKVNPSCAIRLAKKAYQNGVEVTDIPKGTELEYRIQSTSIVSTPVGSFPGAPVIITDKIPSNVTYVANSASCGPVNCQVFISRDNEMTYAPAETLTNAQQEQATHLQFVMLDELAAAPFVETISYRVFYPMDAEGVIQAQPAASSFASGDAVCSTSGSVTTTPVTLAYFRATQDGDVTRFEWGTAVESGNMGFELYVQQGKRHVRINDGMIPSVSSNSPAPQDYTYEATGVQGSVFYLEDVDINGKARKHGPFGLGELYGQPVTVDPIDWAAINTQSRASAQARASADTQALNSEVASVAVASTSDMGAATSLLSEQVAFVEGDAAVATGNPQAYMPLLQAGAGVAEAGKKPPQGQTLTVAGGKVNLGVESSGLYRVTFEDLLNAGINYSGVRSADLALTNRGQPVPIRVVSSTTFGPGAYLEFYGEAIDTLYTGKNIYSLQINSALAKRIGLNKSGISGAVPPATYTEHTVFDDDRGFNEVSPGDEPWHNFELTAIGKAQEGTTAFTIDDYVQGAGPAHLEVEVWGTSSLSKVDNDHHLLIKLNGEQVADVRFDGRVVHTVQIPLRDGLLQPGANSLTLRAPLDHGVRGDIIALDRYTVSYPRALMARNDALTFTAASAVLRVDGFSTPDIVAYRQDTSGALVRLDKIVVEKSERGYAAKFVGSSLAATYHVAATPALRKPSVAAAPTVPNLLESPVDFVMISHPDFVGELARLKQAREAEGYSVKIVDVRDVYNAYSHGIFDAMAIKAYIADAAAQGTQYVLLVGGDSFDYRNYLGTNSTSFIPSLWGATGDVARYTPIDPLFTDLDGDNVPDLPIGRFPVRTPAELRTAIDKTLLYGSNNSYRQNAVFASDTDEPGISFSAQSANFADALGSGWTVKTADLNKMALGEAQTALIEGINQGAGLVSYVGHSDSGFWSFSRLFKSTDVASLKNEAAPTVVFQWGCWNTYFAHPTNNALGHHLMLDGPQGAAAVLGATTLATSTSEAALAPLVMAGIATPGMTLGEAVTAGKQQLGQTNPELRDVLLGWTILGDPTIVITQ